MPMELRENNRPRLLPSGISQARPVPAMITTPVTGNPRVDKRILARMERVGHGTREQRVENFQNGLRGGAGACLAEFRGMRS